MKDRLNSAQKELDTVNPTAPLSLYESTLNIGLHLTNLLQKPHPFSSTLLVGMGYIEHLLLLIATTQGFTLQRPSQIVIDNTNLTVAHRFKTALKNIYINAGVRVSNDNCK